MSRFIDITPALSNRTPAWPGDTPFSAERTWAISDETPVNVSKISMSTHSGAHADAPLHYDKSGAAIGAVEVGAYIGPCTVIHTINSEASVSVEAVVAALDSLGSKINERVLMRTYTQQPEEWDSNFTAISPQAIDWLAGRGVKLVGVDTPSLDPEASKTMDAHKRVFAHDMRILEGLILDHVEPGAYELIAPPLKLEGLDASPVRALLRSKS